MVSKIRKFIYPRPVRVSWQKYTKPNKVNVNEVERLASIFSGGVLVIYGLTRFSFTGLGLAAVGGYLIYRGLTGHCPAYEASRFSTASRTEKLQFESSRYVKPKDFTAVPEVKNRVDQGIAESFPASDPPAWTPGRV